MYRDRVIFESIVLFFDHNDFVLSRRDSLIVNCQLLIVNYKHQFRDLLMNSREPKLSFDISLIQYIIDV